MPHVREGELHAWLDGALDRLESGTAQRVRTHLATCADCRARLEEERALRDEASELLDGVLSGEPTMPPFEDLVRRAQAGPMEAKGSRGGPGRFGFGAPWAWAATVVLALGSGWWMGRGSLDYRDIMAAPEFQAVAPAEDPADAAADEAVGELAAPPADASPSEPTLEQARADIAERAPDTERRQEASPPPPSPVSTDAVARRRVAEARSPQPSAAAEEAAPSGAPSQESRAANAVPGAVQGTVTDRASGRPLAGVQILVPGTAIGALTDAEGRFEIAAALEPDDSLEAVFLGYRSERIAVTGDPTELAIGLSNAQMALDEVVVTGAAAATAAKAAQGQSSALRELDAVDEPGFTPLRGALAGDGGWIALPTQAVLAVYAPVDSNAGAVLQQTARGDSVLLVWSGDDQVAQTLAALATAGSAETEARVQASAGWPSSLRLRRGSALLVVRSTMSEADLRALLEGEGLLDPA